MSVLFNLEDAHWIRVFNFVPLIDLPKFDIALCAREKRVAYLRQLTSRSCDKIPPPLKESPRFHEFQPYQNFLPWLLKRDLKVAYWIRVFRHSLGNLLQIQRFFDMNGTHIIQVDSGRPVRGEGGTPQEQSTMIRGDALLMHSVMEACPNLQYLTINRGSLPYLVGVVAKCPQVIDFRCWDTAFDISAAMTVAWGWPNLEVFQVGRIEHFFSDKCLITLSSCEQLQTLDCGCEELITASALKAIVRKCPLLKLLRAFTITGDVLKEITQHCKLFSHFYAVYLQTSVDDIRQLILCCPLRSVAWWNPADLTGSLYGELRGLQSIEILHEDDEMTDEVVMGIAERNPDLEYVYLISRNLTEASAEVLSQQCPNIREITLCHPDLANVNCEYAKQMVPYVAFPNAIPAGLRFSGTILHPILL